MPVRTRRQQAADRRSRDLRRAIGVDFRNARDDQGVGLRQLAREAGIDPAHLTRIESGTAHASLEVLERVAGALGGELGVRYFPGTGGPLRDRWQAPIVEALLHIRHVVWQPSLEVAVHRPARGVIDVVLVMRDEPTVVAVEVHSEIRRLEQLVRWTNLKRDSLPSSDVWPFLAATAQPALSSLLILRNTSATRAIATDHAATLRTAWPHPAAAAYESVTRGAPWPGSAILWADVAKGVATLKDRPPRGVPVGR